MVDIGIFLSAEEHDGPSLGARRRSPSKRDSAPPRYSDHFHPWLPDQGESPFVWSVLGAVAAATDEVRLDMLEKAINVIARLWDGNAVDHHGRYYTVENAKLWTLPEQPPQVVMSAFGPKAVEVAVRVADGYYGAWPAKGLLQQYRELGGTDLQSVS